MRQYFRITLITATWLAFAGSALAAPHIITDGVASQQQSGMHAAPVGEEDSPTNEPSYIMRIENAGHVIVLGDRTYRVAATTDIHFAGKSSESLPITALEDGMTIRYRTGKKPSDPLAEITIIPQ